MNTESILLHETKIRAALPESLRTALQLHVFETIDSTNQFLKVTPGLPHKTCCLAEMQTHGRGRFGRQWHSPLGENIYCSVLLQLNMPAAQLSGLSLVVSLAMQEVLQQQTSEDIKIKWPNDLMWRDRKLAGTLIELLAESPATNHSETKVIIGMGLNINSITDAYTALDKPWCSLRDITGHVFDRNVLIAKLIHTLTSYVSRFEHEGFSTFQSDWNARDYLKDKTVTLIQGKTYIQGIGCGVNASGYLQLEDTSGTRHVCASGDATIAQTK